MSNSCLAPRFSKNKTGFYYFMRSMMHKNSNLNEEEAYKAAMNDWQVLNQATKDYYKDVAHQIKIGSLNEAEIFKGRVSKNKNKFELMREKREKHKVDLKEYLKDHEKFSRTSFVLLSSKVHFETDKHEVNLFIDGRPMIYPAEISLSVFSVQSGELKHYHWIVMLASDQIPLGYRSTVKEMEAIHHIPVDFGQHDFNFLVKEMQEILENHQILELTNPVYCFSEEVHQNEGILSFLAKNSDFEQFALNLQVLDDLLYECHLAYSNISIFKESLYRKLTETSFDYQIIGCDLHNEYVEMNCCALKSNLKLIYLFLDSVCPLLQIELTKNHLPQCTYNDYHIVG